MIEIPSIKREMLPDGTAYLRIIEFSPQTVVRVREALDWFKTQNYTGSCHRPAEQPRGLAAVCSAGSGPFPAPRGDSFHEVQEPTGKFGLYCQADHHGQCTNLPIVVLINKGSASASEILAGALKDNKARLPCWGEQLWQGFGPTGAALWDRPDSN
jgi:carboxyl-terminal processing protease